MNIIEVLRTFKDVLAVKPFSFMSENVVDGKMYQVHHGSGRIDRNYFMNVIMSGLGEVDLLSDEQWESYEEEIKLTESRFKELMIEAMEETCIVQNSFLGTYQQADAGTVCRYIHNRLFGSKNK